MAENTAKGVSTGKIVSIALIAVLAATVIFLVIQNLGLRSDVEESLETAEDLTAEIKSVENQMEEMEILMGQKDLDVERKQQMLNQRDSLIEAQNTKIENLLARNRISQQEAETMRARVETLEHYVKKYQGQIDVLKQELALKNQEIDSLRGVVAVNRDSLLATRDKYIDASIKVAAASKLVAHSIVLARYKQSGATVPETEFRASQMDRIQVCMDILKNSLPKPGEKVVHLQVKDPQGNLVRDEAKTGFFKYEGKSIPYSAMTRMNYQNEALKVCMDLEQPAGYKYEDGQYTVIAYCEGWEIGKTTFKVE